MTNEFACTNGRCIPNKLECDGFDHCGDNSDESSQCFEAHGTYKYNIFENCYIYKFIILHIISFISSEH